MIGKVLDASTLAGVVRGRVSAEAWFATARALSLPFDPGRLHRVAPALEVDLL